MTIRIALHHKTSYLYDRPVAMSPHVVRLRPAPHCRTPVLSYALKVEPRDHFINWQQDPQGNYLARLVFPGLASKLVFEVDLIAEMTVINPFDFYLETCAEFFPVQYEGWLGTELAPFLVCEPPGPQLRNFLAAIDRRKRKTIDFLVDLNQRLQREIRYLIRMEPGVQTCEQTLTRGSGSCRDSAWLLVQILRHLGLAARFVSGYLIQLTPDEKPLEGPAGPTRDFTDLHAWTEVYLPGAGWLGLDPTSGLLAGEGHLPLACTPDPQSAAPVTGAVDPCETEFQFEMSVRRVWETPRVTKPYRRDQWERIEASGHDVDRRLRRADVRLTMGGEPTFVSIDDRDGAEWTVAAVGPTKRARAEDLMFRLQRRYAPGGLLHFGQGKWYPGEPLPRWALNCYWRKDGEPLWRNYDLLLQAPRRPATFVDAQRFARGLARRLEVDVACIRPAYEDQFYYLWKERRLPANVSALDAKLESEEERARLARIFEHGLDSPVGCLLPLQRQWWQARPRWVSGVWPLRAEKICLLPGDSPMGLRLPLESLPWNAPSYANLANFPQDPLETYPPLPAYQELREFQQPQSASGMRPVLQRVGSPDRSAAHDADHETESDELLANASRPDPSAPVVRTALCVEPRQGKLHIFMPPLDRLEDYLELIAAIEDTAEELQTPMVIEGYVPPQDERLNKISVTPDPGVIEVNVHPAHNWDELVELTRSLYAEARLARLGAEKFDRDGTHTGTGGGNHVVMGAATPADSPFLRRPDLLRSLVSYWHNHPSLSYLFSGNFIGPTSQAPRVDEGRRDAIYELKIAFEQIPDQGWCPPWLVDRIFRHLLVDGTGNTHRAEFCIDKLYSPDSSSGRLGLVEFRAFEMPPHAEMSLTQQLLLRALVAQFWETPYRAPLVDWGTQLHDRFMLPHFVWQDFCDVIQELRHAGFDLETEWFAPHYEFRFPLVGERTISGVQLELRRAIEPWYVLGEEPIGGHTARLVDSSVERLQVRVRGWTEPRFVVTCNGRKLPLHPTGAEGEAVAGLRFRAWQPPSCLHPTIPVDGPLVFDLLDTWLQLSLGGCQYHVGNPGGNNPESFPVNAFEAESRRAARFFAFGHTPGPVLPPRDEPNPDFPLTLDLRKGRHR